MLNNKLILFFFLFVSADTIAQQPLPDSTKQVINFTGALGVTNNGFSIIPSFSLNQPATLIFLSLRKKKFSIDPDVRLTFDARKGGMLLWFRYHAIQKGRFKLRTGFHPAMNLQIKSIESEGKTYEITQMRRFLAWELAPSYRIKQHWEVGIFYLQGNGLQRDGPQTSHFVNLHSNITNIKLGKSIRLALSPAVYYLYLDGFHGYYVMGTGRVSHIKYPVSIQYTFNKTLSSNLPGNFDFLWNAALFYHINKKFVEKK